MISIRPLLSHLLRVNNARIVEQSLLNCHCIGLHSIMLLDSPGQTIRLYVAQPGNHLYKNSQEFFRNGMSIGFHPHHCDLTLHCVKGQFINWELREMKYADDKPLLIDKYAYRSQITSGKSGFELIDEQVTMAFGTYRTIEQGRFITLPANQLHTVVCDPFSVSAWLVYEGKEDANYQPVCYSTSMLENFSAEGLYQKPDAEQVNDLIELSGLLNDRHDSTNLF